MLSLKGCISTVTCLLGECYDLASLFHSTYSQIFSVVLKIVSHVSPCFRSHSCWITENCNVTSVIIAASSSSKPRCETNGSLCLVCVSVPLAPRWLHVLLCKTAFVPFEVSFPRLRWAYRFLSLSSRQSRLRKPDCHLFWLNEQTVIEKKWQMSILYFLSTSCVLRKGKKAAEMYIMWIRMLLWAFFLPDYDQFHWTRKVGLKRTAWGAVIVQGSF